MPAETSGLFGGLAGSRGYLMPVTVPALLGVLATIAWLPGQIRATMASISTARCLSSDRFGLLVNCHLRHRCAARRADNSRFLAPRG